MAAAATATSFFLFSLPRGCFIPERESEGNNWEGWSLPSRPLAQLHHDLGEAGSGSGARACCLALFSVSCLSSPGQTPSEETKGPIDPLTL